MDRNRTAMAMISKGTTIGDYLALTPAVPNCRGSNPIHRSHVRSANTRHWMELFSQLYRKRPHNICLRSPDSPPPIMAWPPSECPNLNFQHRPSSRQLLASYRNEVF